MIDLHNDLITFDKLSFLEKQERIKKDKQDEATVYYALFLGGKDTTYLNLFSWAKELDNLSIEDIGGIDNFVDILSFSPKYITLTWNTDNTYAGGAFGDGELSRKGKELIGKLNDNSIALDLSHLNRKSYYQVIERAERVLVSHTCCDKICSHKRNLTDDQIRLLIERNGIVGLTFVRGFLTKNREAKIEDVVAHIDYFCNKFSFRNLAIGTDFFGTENGVIGIDDYLDFYKIRIELKRLGYSDNAIEAIMSNNAERFLINSKCSP